jgi:hypothetical protein
MRIFRGFLNLPNHYKPSLLESPTTRGAGGLDFSAWAGKTKARQCLNPV